MLPRHQAPLCLLVSFSLAGCLLPSARPIAYTPRPEQASDPQATLRALAQQRCKQGAEVELKEGVLQYTSPCDTSWRGAQVPTLIDLPRVTDIRISFGDWYQVSLVQGERVLSPAVLSFERQQDAERAVDALWALKTAPR